MKIVFSEASKTNQSEIIQVIKDFNNKGENIYGGSRNTIKTYNVKDFVINVKSFKIPNIINQIAYRFFRKSKAQRSFEYAEKLKSLHIGTPQPIAYFENSNVLFFKDSFYVSEHLQADLTFRELTKDFNYPNHTEILKAFTRFTYKLHENDIEFLDHSPGNTLIKLNNGDYKFYLVDLNRMNFKKLTLDERIKNFARLTSSKKIVAIMSKEYARLVNKPEEEIYQKMWQYTSEFQEKFYRKKRLKKRLKFWKS